MTISSEVEDGAGYCTATTPGAERSEAPGEVKYPPLPPTEGETLTPDVKEIVAQLNTLKGYPDRVVEHLALQASQALLRLAGELEASHAMGRFLLEKAESSRTQAEGKMKGYGRQTIDGPQHCTGGGE